MDKYFSNDDVERKRQDFQDDDEDQEDDEAQEDGYGQRGKKRSSLPRRYLDYYSDDKDDDTGQFSKSNDKMSIEELDGWMNQVNEKMKKVEEYEAQIDQ